MHQEFHVGDQVRARQSSRELNRATLYEVTEVQTRLALKGVAAYHLADEFELCSAGDRRFHFEKGDLVVARTNQDGLVMGRTYCVAGDNLGCRVALRDMSGNYSPFDFQLATARPTTPVPTPPYFQLGDEVRCLRTHDGLGEGMSCRVQSVETNGDLRLRGWTGRWRPGNFELVSGEELVTRQTWEQFLTGERQYVTDRLDECSQQLDTMPEDQPDPLRRLLLIHKQQVLINYANSLDALVECDLDEDNKLEALPTDKLVARVGEWLAELLSRKDANEDQFLFLGQLLASRHPDPIKPPEWPKADEEYELEMGTRGSHRVWVREVVYRDGEWHVRGEQLAGGVPTGNKSWSKVADFQHDARAYRDWKNREGV